MLAVYHLTLILSRVLCILLHLQDARTRQQTLEGFKSHTQQCFWSLGKTGLVIFPEGTFFWKGKAKSQRYEMYHSYLILCIIF